MIFFERPGWLLLVVPWLLAGWWFAVTQCAAHRWVLENVAPRHRHRLTRHGARGFARRLGGVLAAGVLLVLAAAGPALPEGGGGRVEGGRVLLLLDGSASMYATDVAAAGEETISRFDAARTVARGLVGELREYRFGVASFAGEATIHLPIVADRGLLEDALDTIETHNFFRNSGSSLAAALDLALEVAGPAAGPASDLQVVLLGDGELPKEEAYDESLAALAARGVPVHAVTLGSLEGQQRVIWNMADVMAQKPADQRRVLKRFTTVRVDEHLRRVATATGGTFSVLDTVARSPEVGQSVVRAVRRVTAKRPFDPTETVPRDLSAWPLALFLVLFLADAFDASRSGGRPTPVFDLSRLGPPAGSRRSPAGNGTRGVSTLGLLLAWSLLGGCDLERAAQAHRENEAGITLDAVGAGAVARTHYRRSAAFEVRPEVPTYNLARSLALDGDFSSAHELFQEAIGRAPAFGQALFNDGVTLYRWGQEELDPEGCELDRTLELWRAARKRFAEVAAGPFEAGLVTDGEADERFVAEAVTRLEAAAANPPPHCRGGAGGAGSDGASADGADADGADAGGASADGASADGSGGDGAAADRQSDAQGDRGEGGDSGGEDEGGGSSGGEPDLSAPLTGGELAQLEAEIERIRAQAREPGKFHRRTQAEQLPRDSWQRPDREIWW